MKESRMRGRTLTALVALAVVLAVVALRLRSEKPSLTTSEGQTSLSPKDVIDVAGDSAARGSTGTSPILPQIRAGQTVTGSLTSADSLYPDTTYYQAYQFMTTPGREITIDLSSSDFDPVLIVSGGGLAQSIVDDDGGPGCASRVSQAFLGRGPYRILVNTTVSPHRQTGRFTLAISEGSQHVQGRSENDCSPAGAEAAGTPVAAVTSIRVGETINGTLTSGDSLYPDNTYFKYYQFTAPAWRPVTIDLASDDFDPELIIRGEDLDASIINDNGGPGGYARASRPFPRTRPDPILAHTTESPGRPTG